MRRENRIKVQNSSSTLDKTILYTGIGLAVLAVIVFALYMYSKSLNEDMKNSTMDLEKIASISENNTENTQSASTNIGKTVEESKNETSNSSETNQANTTVENKTNNTIAKNTTNNTTTNKATNRSNNHKRVKFPKTR